MTPSAARSAHRWLAIALVAVVAIQAVLAGRHLYEGADIDLHGYLGNATFVVSVLVTIAAWRGRLDGRLLALGGVVLVACFAQTGLGYVGRDSTGAAAWHVSLGVVIFGLGSAQAALAMVGLPARSDGAEIS